ARLGGRHDQAPLALADGGDEVDDAAGEVLGAAVARLQYQPLVGEQWRVVLEEDLVAGVFRRVEVDVIDLEQGEVALAFLGGADLAGDAVAGAQVEAPYLAGGDIDVVGAGQVGGVGGAQKTKTIGEDFENTVTVDVLATLGVALEDVEDDVLFAGAGLVFEADVLADFDQFGNGLGFQISQIHRKEWLLVLVGG